MGSSYCFFEHGGKLKSSIVADMARPLGIHNAHSGYPITEGKYLLPPRSLFADNPCGPCEGVRAPLKAGQIKKI